MKFSLFFFFLLLVPSVFGIAVSPASLTFVDSSAQLVVLNDHSFETSYTVGGSVLKQDFVIAAREKKLIKLKLRKDADASGVVSLREVSNVSGFSVITGLDVPYDSMSLPLTDKAKALIEEFENNKLTGNAISSVKSVASNSRLVMFGVIGLLVVVGLAYWFFSEKKDVKKLFNKNKKSFGGRKHARKFKYNKVRR